MSDTESKTGEEYEKSSDSSTEIFSISHMRNIRSTPKCIQGAIPWPENDHDSIGRQFVLGLRTMIKIDHENLTEKEERGKWVGKIVTKTFYGERYAGEVVDFNIKTKWYKIVYEDDDSEEVEKEELLQILAPPEIAQGYLLRKLARKHEKKYKACCARALGQPEKCPSSSKKRTATKKKVSKPKKSAAATGPYIPLAFKETKKDAYYWY